MNAVSIRGDWADRKIDGRFPLQSWLGGSGTTGVFLTEIVDQSPIAPDASSSASEPRKAAIKLMAASAVSQERVAMWTSAASLSHPHLARILHFGRTEVDGALVVYIVTEYAEEILGQIIPERSLTPEEARQMLVPVLDALTYLHGRGWVHGHIKPSNILVVENEVKLSSDGLLAADNHANEAFSNHLHNAPEISSGPVTPAADVWSLGVTLVEALTQQLPIWDAASEAEPEVPSSLPAPFADIVRECLHTDPERRCSLDNVRTMLEGKPIQHSQPQAEPVVRASQRPGQFAPRKSPSKIAIALLMVGFVLLVAIIIGVVMRGHKTETVPSQTETAQQAPSAEPRPSGTAQSPQNAPAEVIDRSIPDVPRGASSTIHGTVSVSVRLTVDETGAVSNAEFANHGPSAYFARLALESAHKWKFKPAQQNGTPVASTWILHYEFRRGGTDVKSAQIKP